VNECFDLWQVLVCSGNCPLWYRVTEYKFENETRSDCINAFVYSINDSKVIQYNRRIYYTMFFGVGYAIPLTIICVLYVFLVRRIGGQGRVGAQSGEVRRSSLNAAATRRRVMKMVTSVIITFAVCWLPTHVMFLVEAYGSVHEYYHIEMVAFQIIATCMAYANSCLNPVIYAFLSENFRQSFRELLSLGKNRSDRRAASGARSADGGLAPGGRSNGLADGNQGVQMKLIKLPLPRNELSGIGSTCYETY